jgi:tetratricopeptide (TPR) repeat protein
MRWMAIAQSTGRILIVLLSVGPAIWALPQQIRPSAAAAVVVGGLIGYALVQGFRSSMLTDPSWRGPAHPARRRWWHTRRRREYVVPVEVPPPPNVLIGRDPQVREIRDFLVTPANTTRVVVITGPCGVGKSALAVSVTQALTDHFRDGQLLARLDRVGHGTDGVHEVLRMFVNSLQAPADTAPKTSADLIRRYRELTTRNRVLVVLDSATDLDQVRQMLPHGRGCAAIITSRDPSLADRSWRSIRIDRLSEKAALRVLDALVGGDRVEAEPSAARQLVAAAARVPLGLQLIGAALYARQNWTLQVAVQRMRQGHLVARSDSLPAFSAALDLSYVLLTEPERTGLLLLGLIGEPSFAGWEMSALVHGTARPGDGNDSVNVDVNHDDERTQMTAAQILDRLVYARLVQRTIDDTTGVASYSVAEHVKPYVRTRLFAETDPDTRHAAVASLNRARRRHGTPRPDSDLRNHVHYLLDAGQLTGALNVARQLLAWAQQRVNAARTDDQRQQAKQEVGLALVTLAEVNVELGWMEQARQDAEASQQTRTDPCRPRALVCLGSVHARNHRLAQAELCLSEAVGASNELGATPEAIRAMRDLAVVQARRGRADEALATIEKAFELSRSQADVGRRRLPGMLWAKGAVMLARGESFDAQRVLLEAESICGDESAGQGLWLPWIRHGLALAARARRDYARSRELALQASQGFRDMHHRYGVGNCRMVVGWSYLDQGNATQAIQVLEDSVQTLGGCGDRWLQATCRMWLAKAHLAVGDYRTAAHELGQADQVYRDLGDDHGRREVRTVATMLRRRREVAGHPVVWALPLVGARVRG